MSDQNPPEDPTRVMPSTPAAPAPGTDPTGVPAGSAPPPGTTPPAPGSGGGVPGWAWAVIALLVVLVALVAFAVLRGDVDGAKDAFARSVQLCRQVGDQPVHLPARRMRSPSVSRRGTARISAMVISAVSSVSTSGVLVTVMPSSLARLRSM